MERCLRSSWDPNRWVLRCGAVSTLLENPFECSSMMCSNLNLVLERNRACKGCGGKNIVILIAFET